MEKVKSIKILIALAVVLATLCVLSAMPLQTCEAREITELHIGYQPSTHQIAHMTAMEKGWWESDLNRFGIEKVTDSVFPSGPPEMISMMAGELDVAYVGTAPPIPAIDKGLDAKIVAAVQTNGSAIVLSPELAANYTSPEDLKGLKIATFPKGSIQDTILRKWLMDNGLDPVKDVDIKGMGPGEAITEIEAGVVDAVFLPAPSPTIIEMDGAGKTVVYSGQMWPNHACCCLLVSGELIREHPELVEQIVRTHINATEYNKEHVEEAGEIYTRKVVGSDVEMVKESLKRWDGAWICDPHLEMDSTVEYAKVDYEMGYTDKLLTKDDLFDTRFYDKIVEIAPTPTPEVTPTPTPTPTPSPTPPTPGFTAVFAIAALLAVTYLVLRRRF
ncbi:NitT/TauT family transport system substrate-binding protein [ANME-1 cluster archaeon GoMg1]|nr:NitT/TauT family transport system substrate-binding protein [ANME-1 cluster archaeon GoMg1]